MGYGAVCMSRMRTAALPIAFALAIAALLLAAPALGVPLVDGADEPVSATTDTETESPGATLSGAVASEQATLDGEVQTKTYEHRLQNANSSSERAAVLAAMSEDLERRSEALSRQQKQLESERPTDGRTVYATSKASVEGQLLRQLAKSGSDVQIVNESELPPEVRERFQHVRNETKTYAPPDRVDGEFVHQPNFEVELDEIHDVPEDMDINRSQLEQFKAQHPEFDFQDPSNPSPQEVHPELSGSTVVDVSIVYDRVMHSPSLFGELEYNQTMVDQLSNRSVTELVAAGYVDSALVDSSVDADSTTETDSSTTDTDDTTLTDPADVHPELGGMTVIDVSEALGRTITEAETFDEIEYDQALLDQLSLSALEELDAAGYVDSADYEG